MDSSDRALEQEEVTVTTMEAIVRDQYGLPDVLQLEEVEVPEIEDNQLLVRVHASSVNAMEWHLMTGKPYLVHLQSGMHRPKRRGLGGDVAGTVEAIGAGVERFAVGDEVIAEAGLAAYAEYAPVREENTTIKPAGVSFEHAGALPVAGLTAVQGLRDVGKLQAGQHVLINGASGGVGTFAIQIAKALGAKVTAVCSSQNVEAAWRLGADHVIDYTKEDFTKGEARYDLLYDIPAIGSVMAAKSILKPNGRYVMVGGPKGRWLGPLPRVARAKLAFLGRSQTAHMFLAHPNGDDLGYLAELMAAEKITPEIEATYPLSETPEALRRFGRGHLRGKIVITV
jgi:NADPH:quinone reductase-like Zn-dependent oxidoreductase